MHCQNPNPYAVEILSSKPGRVLVGPVGENLQSRTAIGHLEVVPGSMLPSGGEGIVRVQMNAKLSGETSGLLIPEFLGDSAIPILMELRFSVGINVYFMPYILPPWAPPTAPSFKQECGLNMMGVLVNQFVSAQAPGKESRLGPLVCRESFTGMVIPPVGESPPDGKMAFTAAQVAPTEVFAGEVAKDASLFLVIGISYFCCFVFAHVWIFGAPPESAKRAYAGCGSRLNSCYKSLKNENTLPWKDLTLLSTSGKASRPQMDPKSTEHLLGISKDASQWTNITDAQRKDSVDTRDFLLQRPRRESNSSGGLSETESQAMLRAGGAGTSSVATRDADVSDAREGRAQQVTLLQPDRTLSQHAARASSRSPSRPSRIASARQRGRSTGSERGSGDDEGMIQERSRSRLSAQDRPASPGLARSRSPSQLRHSSPSYTSMPENGAVGAPLTTVFTDQTDATTKESQV